MEPIPAQHHLAGWIPWKAAEPGPDLAWLPLDGGRFHEPFFEDTLGRLKRAHAVFYGTRTLFDLLDADLEGLERLQPALLVFHISRCGSTLLAQMLGTDPAVEVLSEPPLLDHLLRSGQDSRIDPLLALLGQRRFPESRHLVLKLDSWHLAFHGRLRALYPTVPCVLLYREPARVMASHRLLRGMHALPGVLDPALFGFDPRELPQPTLGVDAGVYLDSHLELVLGRYFEWMQAIARGDRNSLLLDFEAGPEACYRSLLAFAGWCPGAPILQAALERTAFHGKHGGMFIQEPPAPPAPAGLQRAYARLDDLRRAGLQGAAHDQRP